MQSGEWKNGEEGSSTNQENSSDSSPINPYQMYYLIAKKLIACVTVYREKTEGSDQEENSSAENNKILDLVKNLTSALQSKDIEKIKNAIISYFFQVNNMPENKNGGVGLRKIAQLVGIDEDQIKILAGEEGHLIEKAIDARLVCLLPPSKYAAITLEAYIPDRTGILHKLKNGLRALSILYLRDLSYASLSPEKEIGAVIDFLLEIRKYNAMLESKKNNRIPFTKQPVNTKLEEILAPLIKLLELETKNKNNLPGLMSDVDKEFPKQIPQSNNINPDNYISIRNGMVTTAFASIKQLMANEKSPLTDEELKHLRDPRLGTGKFETNLKKAIYQLQRRELALALFVLPATIQNIFYTTYIYHNDDNHAKRFLIRLSKAFPILLTKKLLETDSSNITSSESLIQECAKFYALMNLANRVIEYAQKHANFLGDPNASTRFLVSLAKRVKSIDTKRYVVCPIDADLVQKLLEELKADIKAYIESLNKSPRNFLSLTELEKAGNLGVMLNASIKLLPQNEYKQACDDLHTWVRSIALKQPTPSVIGSLVSNVTATFTKSSSSRSSSAGSAQKTLEEDSEESDEDSSDHAFGGL